MNTIMDLCMLCTRDYNCVPVDDKIISQVEYILPEITIIKLGIPLHICSVCDGAIYAFSKFKQLYMESSRRLEASIRAECGRNEDDTTPLYINSGHFMDSETCDTEYGQIEEDYTKDKHMGETSLDTHFRIENVRVLNAETSDLEAEKVDKFNNEPDGKPENLEIPFEIEKDNFYDVQQSSKNEDTNVEIWEVVDSEEEPENNSKYICTLCNKKFTNKNSLNNHMKKHNGVIDFVCTICDKTFTNCTGLNQHMKVHSIQENNLQCTICEKSFTQQNHLTFHMQAHYSNQQVLCSICNMSFLFNYELYKHMKVQHPEIKHKLFYCEYCDKSYTRRDHLVRHMKCHSGIKDIACPICNKLFLRTDHMKIHMLTHTRQKKFACEVCNKLFIRRDQMNLHMKVHSRKRKVQNKSVKN